MKDDMHRSGLYRQLAVVLTGAAALALALAAPADDLRSPPKFERRVCADPAIAADVRCGVVRVPENYARALERQIELNVMILPAQHPTSQGIAQYDLDGGPGEVIRHGGHLFEGLSGLDTCFDTVVIDFFDSASVTDLDTSCLAGMRSSEYVTSMQR